MSGVLGGCIYFEEISDFSFLQIAMFASGCAVIILGIAILSRHDGADTTPAPASGAADETSSGSGTPPRAGGGGSLHGEHGEGEGEEIDMN